MIKYRYIFGDGFVFVVTSELPFNVLKVAVDVHNGLVKMQKVVEVLVDA